MGSFSSSFVRGVGAHRIAKGGGWPRGLAKGAVGCCWVCLSPCVVSRVGAVLFLVLCSVRGSPFPCGGIGPCDVCLRVAVLSLVLRSVWGCPPLRGVLCVWGGPPPCVVFCVEVVLLLLCFVCWVVLPFAQCSVLGLVLPHVLCFAWGWSSSLYCGLCGGGPLLCTVLCAAVVLFLVLHCACVGDSMRWWSSSLRCVMCVCVGGPLLAQGSVWVGKGWCSSSSRSAVLCVCGGPPPCASVCVGWSSPLRCALCGGWSSPLCSVLCGGGPPLVAICVSVGGWVGG